MLHRGCSQLIKCSCQSIGSVEVKHEGVDGSLNWDVVGGRFLHSAQLRLAFADRVLTSI